MGGGDTPSPTPSEPLTISLKIKNNGVERDYEYSTDEDCYILQQGDTVVAKFNRPLTLEEIYRTSALYLINDQYEGIVIANDGQTVSCYIMSGLNTHEATEYRREYQYPVLQCLTAQFVPASEVNEITFDAPVGKWGPYFRGPLTVTPQNVEYPSFQTAEIENYNGSRTYKCLTTSDGKLILCGLGEIDLDWDSNFPEYSPIYQPDEGVWAIGENMADVSVDAAKVKQYINDHGYELWPDGYYLNSQLFAFVDGKIVITLLGGQDGPGYVSRSITIPAFPSI